MNVPWPGPASLSGRAAHELRTVAVYLPLNQRRQLLDGDSQNARPFFLKSEFDSFPESALKSVDQSSTPKLEQSEFCRPFPIANYQMRLTDLFVKYLIEPALAIFGRLVEGRVEMPRRALGHDLNRRRMG